MRIITRTVFVLSMVSLLADVASEMLYPVIPVYLQQVGFGVFVIGLIEGIVNFIAGISKGYFGKRSDERGLRLPFVRLGYFLSAVAKPMIVFFVYAPWILLVRSIDRLGKGVRTAARDALLSQEATPGTKARVFGFHRSMDTAGAAIGPIIAFVYLFLHPGRYTPLFYFAFIPGLLSVALVFVLREKKQPAARIGGRNFFSYFRYWNIAPRQFRRVVPALLLFALFNSSDIFLVLAVHAIAVKSHVVVFGRLLSPDSVTIAAYIFYNIVYAAFSYPFGALADRLGYRVVLLTGFVVFAAVYGGFAIAGSVTFCFILFFIYGLFSAATEGIIKAWIANVSQGENTATAIGFYTSCESICALLASTIAGWIWVSAGSTVTFGATAVVTLCVCLYFLFAVREK